MEKYDWQSWVAISIVFVTILGFGKNLFWKKRSKSAACGGSCGCSKKWTEKDFVSKSQ